MIRRAVLAGKVAGETFPAERCRRVNTLIVNNRGMFWPFQGGLIDCGLFGGLELAVNGVSALRAPCESFSWYPTSRVPPAGPFRRGGFFAARGWRDRLHKPKSHRHTLSSTGDQFSCSDSPAGGLIAPFSRASSTIRFMESEYPRALRVSPCSLSFLGTADQM